MDRKTHLPVWKVMLMEEGRLFDNKLERLPPHVPSLPKWHTVPRISPPEHMFKKKLF